MKPTELGDIIAAAWAGLTDDQRIAWNFYSLAHPITSSRGDKIALYGWQGFYEVNALIGIVDATALLLDPPTTTAPPTPITTTGQVWTKRARLANGTTLRGALAWIETAEAIPAGTAVIIKQSYNIRSNKTRRLPRTRHVTVWKETETGPINLQVPRGYYASTNGANKFASVRGRTAARRKDLPLCRAIWLNMATGDTTETTINNPTT